MGEILKPKFGQLVIWPKSTEWVRTFSSLVNWAFGNVLMMVSNAIDRYKTDEMHEDVEHVILWSAVIIIWWYVCGLQEREFGYLVTVSAGRRVPLRSGIIIPHNNVTYQPPYCSKPNQIAVTSAAPLLTAQYHYMEYIESNHRERIWSLLPISAKICANPSMPKS